MLMYNFILIIILIIIYFFQETYIYFAFSIVFFLCSLLFIYLGAVLLSLKKKNKKINIYSIYILIKKLSRIILTLIILLNSNSNSDLITLYSNHIIENGLNDDPTIQEVIDELEVTPNQQYYLKIGTITAAVGIGIVIIYVLNNWFRPEGPIDSSSGSGVLTRSSSSSSLSSSNSNIPYLELEQSKQGINVSDVILPIAAITGPAIEFTLNILEAPVTVKEDVVVNNLNILEEPIKEKELLFSNSLKNNIDSSDSYELFYFDNKFHEEFYGDEVEFYYITSNSSDDISSDIETKSSSDDDATLDLPSQTNNINNHFNIEKADAEFENSIDDSKMDLEFQETMRVVYLNEIESFIKNFKRYELLNPKMAVNLEEGIPIFQVLKEYYDNYYSYINSGGELNTPKYDILWNDLIDIWTQTPRMEIERVAFLAEIELFIENFKQYELVNPEIALKLEMAIDTEGIPLIKVLKEYYDNYYSYINSGYELNTPKYNSLWTDLVCTWMQIPEFYKKLFKYDI